MTSTWTRSPPMRATKSPCGGTLTATRMRSEAGPGAAGRQAARTRRTRRIDPPGLPCTPIMPLMTTTIPPQQRIEADVKAALKAGEKEKLSTLRMLLGEIKNERIRRGGEVDEAGFVSLVRKSIKQREEAATQYHAGHREELAAKEESEAKILATYLPAQVDEGQIRAAIEELVASRSLSGPAAIGPIMKELLARFGSSADGATINRIAREVLAKPAG